MQTILTILTIIGFFGSCLTFYFSDELSKNGKMKFLIYGSFSLFMLSSITLIINKILE